MLDGQQKDKHDLNKELKPQYEMPLVDEVIWGNTLGDLQDKQCQFSCLIIEVSYFAGLSTLAAYLAKDSCTLRFYSSNFYEFMN